jgi:hypothetical protein
MVDGVAQAAQHGNVPLALRQLQRFVNAAN